jgi:hypothetical protein
MVSLIIGLFGAAILILGISAFRKLKYLDVAEKYWDKQKNKKGDPITPLKKKSLGFVYVLLGLLLIPMSLGLHLNELEDQEKEARIKSEASRLGMSTEDFRKIDRAFAYMPKGSTIEDYKNLDTKAKDFGFEDGYDYLLEEYRAKKEGKTIDDVIAARRAKEEAEIVANEEKILAQMEAEKVKEEESSEETGEVGKLLLVEDPVASPLFVSNSGSKYWPCSGFVNKKVINIIYDELKQLSESYSVSPPLKDLCLYHISNTDFGFGPVTMYQVEMFINQSSRDACLNDNYCDNVRNMTFKVINDTLNRQYLITNVDKRLTKMSCISMNGQVVSADSGCS